MIATRTLSITQLYEDHIDKLRLSWVAAVGVERQVELRDMEIYGPDVVGHLNLIYSHRVQVIGKAEQRWLEQVGEERWLRQIDDLMAAKPPALIVADGLEPPPGVREICEKTQTPLFSSPKDCSAVIDLLHLYLARRFADTVSAHGVFMDVFGLGVLITGDSGVGKSELALELVSRGHGLVADDVVGHLDALDGGELVANHLLHCFLKLRVAVIAELGCKTNNRTLADSNSFTKL